MMLYLANFFNLIGMSLLIYAAIHDLTSRTVPNWTSGSIAVLALPPRILEGNLEPAIIFSMSVFGILTLFWALRLLGGGDVKLWAAATLLIPPFWRTECLAFNRIVLIGGVLALIYLGLHRVLRFKKLSFLHPRGRCLWQRAINSELWRMQRGGSLPYAVAISVGMLLTLWSVL